MSDPSIDLDAYRRRIGFDGPFVATFATLARLIERHAATIPFENIEVLAGRVPGLDLASLGHKLVERRRGGYCFEQNGLFLACLRQAGFAVRGLEARVRTGVPADVVTGRTHMALRVTLEGVDYLADVGFGALAPMAPLKLDSRAEQATASGVYRIVDCQGERLLQAETDQGWSDCYRIGPAEPHPVDYEMGNWYVATHPKAFLRQNLLVARAVEGGRLTLFNRQLALRRSATAAAEERTLGTRAEFAVVLADRFGLEIEALDLDAVMAVVDRQAATPIDEAGSGTIGHDSPDRPP
ncbi:MAG: arylamine N-acetyltransferase family protein [Caldimonas sp.]